MDNCLICGKKPKRSINRYCSNKCLSDDRYHKYINNWKKGLVDGSRGITAKNISRHVDRYIREKYHNKCLLCGWNQINKFLNKVPVEVDHIDGNSENNNESNLRLICPNCHSLSKMAN